MAATGNSRALTVAGDAAQAHTAAPGPLSDPLPPVGARIVAVGGQASNALRDYHSNGVQ